MCIRARDGFGVDESEWWRWRARLRCGKWQSGGGDVKGWESERALFRGVARF